MTEDNAQSAECLSRLTAELGDWTIGKLPYGLPVKNIYQVQLLDNSIRVCRFKPNVCLVGSGFFFLDCTHVMQNALLDNEKVTAWRLVA